MNLSFWFFYSMNSNIKLFQETYFMWNQYQVIPRPTREVDASSLDVRTS